MRRAAWQRLDYDAESAASAMRQDRLTGGYHETLLNGLWPSLDILPTVERCQRGIPLSPASLAL